MPDDVFLYAVGILVILAQHAYGLTGWPCPGLVDKT